MDLHAVRQPRRHGASRRRSPVLAAALLLVLAAAPSTASARDALRASIAPIHQTDLLAAGGVWASLRSRLGGRVRLTVVAAPVAGGRGSVALGPTRLLRLRARRWRNVFLPLSAAARGALDDCEPRALVATLAPRSRSSRTRRARASASVALDPPHCGAFFAPDSPWRMPTPAAAPLDPRSGSIVSTLLSQVGGPPPRAWINTTAYSTPIVTVRSGQPRVAVTLDRPEGIGADLRPALTQVPIPPGVRPAAGTDGDLVVWQPSTDSMWEFWRLHAGGDGWHAQWGGRFDGASASSGVFGPPHPNWGASASGLALAGGIIGVDELRRGHIDHALALSIPAARADAFATPAQRTDGRASGDAAIPEGARLRLDPSLDVAALNLPPVARMIAEAAQRYGFLVRDQGADVSFYAQDPSTLPSDPYPALFGGLTPRQLLARFPWSRMQLVRMDLRAAGPASNCLIPVLCG